MKLGEKTIDWSLAIQAHTGVYSLLQLTSNKQSVAVVVITLMTQLVEELLPDVEDAPILGGHNRQSKQPAQSSTPLEQSVTMPSNESLVNLARNEERVCSPRNEFVERRPARNVSMVFRSPKITSERCLKACICVLADSSRLRASKIIVLQAVANQSLIRDRISIATFLCGSACCKIFTQVNLKLRN